MKDCVSKFVWALAALYCVVSGAFAQSPYLTGFQTGGSIYEPAAFQAVQGELGGVVGWPGRVWVSGNYADRGLGYRGSYLTLGMKSRLFEDLLDGRWLFEGRGHVSEEGGFFSNFGLERVFTIVAADADVSLGAWFDYDDDQGAFEFADTFIAWGVTGQIKTRQWDLIANGYFPEGTSDNAFGDPTGNNAFFQNVIVLRPGIDSALKGFDVTLRTRPCQLAFVNGSIDFGGYGYQSDLVPFFGGGRMRLNTQILRGALFTSEINYDDRFKLTGLLGMTFQYGANARGAEYTGLAKDLERTARNDHIVRFNQDAVLLIDPDTGAPYNVVHVDNTADAGFANGFFETPFTSLADAEAASAPDDIIFVNEGDGTTRNYDTGIVLKDGQLFLGTGVQHLIPTLGGELFELTNDQDGIRPRITADGGGNAVTLANRNTVRGFVIDGNAATMGGMARGIFGSAGVTNTDGIIEDNMIFGAILDGVGVRNLAGDWRFARNDIQNNGFSGISLIDACDPTSIFNFDSNIASNNGLDGIQMINYDALEINFTNNITDSNGRDGIHLETFKGDPLVGVDILIDNHLARFNTGIAISIIDGAGSITISNSTIGSDFDNVTTLFTPGGNAGGGINLVDFTTPGATDQILIDGNDINGNGVGVGAGINIALSSGSSRALITDNEIALNGFGIFASVDPMGMGMAILDVNVIDNVSIGSAILGGNASDGIRALAQGGGQLNLLVDQSTGNLQMFGNGSISGNGITLVAGDDSGGVVSPLNAVIRNVNIVASGNDGVAGNVVEDGQLNLFIERSNVNTSGGDGFEFNLNTNETLAINTIVVRDTTVDNSGFSGFEFNSLAGSFADVVITNVAFTNTALGGARPTGVGPTGLAEGVMFNVAGDPGMMNPQVDSRTRLFFQDNAVDRFTLDAFAINTSGDASVLAVIDSNSFTNSGDGFLTVMQPDLPFFDGISLTAVGSSNINARITNNLSAGNAERGVDILTAGTSSINALFIGNILGSNDVAEDMANMIVDSGLEDFRAINGVGSTICLSFSNNVFGLPELLVNNAGVGSFILELQGSTNGGFGIALPANIILAPFGSTCEPLVAAEEAAFAADGFPAQ